MLPRSAFCICVAFISQIGFAQLFDDSIDSDQQIRELQEQQAGAFNNNLARVVQIQEELVPLIKARYGESSHQTYIASVKLNFFRKMQSFSEQELQLNSAITNRSALAYQLLTRGNHKRAIPEFKWVLQSRTKLFGASNILNAGDLHVLGDCYRKLGDLENSAKYLKNAKDMFKAEVPPTRDYFFEPFRELAQVYASQAKTGSAISVLEEACSISRKTPGKKSLQHLENTRLLAYYCQMGSKFRRCIEVLEDRRTLVDQEFDLFQPNVDSQLAICYWAIGDLTKADQIIQRNYELAKKEMDVSRMMGAFNNNVALLVELRDYARLNALWSESQKSLKEASDLDSLGRHLWNQTLRTSVANVYLKVGNITAAKKAISRLADDKDEGLRQLKVRAHAKSDEEEELLTEVQLSIKFAPRIVSEKRSVDEKLDNLELRALLYERKGNDSRAEEVHRERIRFLKSCVGEQNFEVAKLYREFGSFFAERQKFKLAREQFSTAAKICEKTAGKNSIMYAKCLFWIGVLDVRLGQREEGTKALLESVERYRRVFREYPNSFTAVMSEMKDKVRKMSSDEDYNQIKRVIEKAS